MIVDVADVRARFAARVEALAGYAEADGPFDPGATPANVGLRAFAILVPQTLPAGTRDRSLGTMEVVSRVTVRCQSPVGLAGPDRIVALDVELKAEWVLVRDLMRQGDVWNQALRISFAGTERQILGDEWLQTDINFDVGHTVQL